SYDKPLHIVRGRGCYLYDSDARAYLDLYNNVAHLGHQHPKIVRAITEQTALLNTNSRYLHELRQAYTERLCALLPEGLEVAYFVNSASEANELALRMAQAYTHRKDMLVVEHAYHGHTSNLIDLSPYKHDGPGGAGAPNWVHSIPQADPYRGGGTYDDPHAGEKYAQVLADKLDELGDQNRLPAAFIAETYPSVGGQIIPPVGYLTYVQQHLRQRGVLYIADEVQTGMGRIGSHWWAFATEEVIPDIVVLGKPIGNGYPLAAVITTRTVADAFDNGMEYFSTYGGNPVAMAAGLAVLDAIEEEDLLVNALQVGKLFMDGLKKLQDQCPLIGDVRGAGLFLG
ncbi:MAG: aminotransferase class III-fold pyridoxal phosphate-dependent enzyme, partial [Bacteroidota bacterium]